METRKTLFSYYAQKRGYHLTASNNNFLFCNFTLKPKSTIAFALIIFQNAYNFLSLQSNVAQ